VPYACITLDLLLPDMEGRDVLQAVRLSGLNGTTPVIVVTVVPDKGVGAGFRVSDILTKPVTSEELTAAIHRAVGNEAGGALVLVVDDSAKDRKLAEKLLHAEGYRVSAHGTAKAALAAALKNPPAAVVLDLLMPEMDGVAFLHQFRAVVANRLTPVIVWTGKDLTAGEHTALRRKGESVVRKGDGASALLSELRAHVVSPALPVVS
jgi:CheY-like chemotaxis protein